MDNEETKLYMKVLGIDEARKQTIPMPDGVKIPKTARLKTTGGRCNVCGNETIEGHEDGHGMWHYRCTYCITHQKLEEEACPRCGCRAHGKYDDPYSVDKSPFRPSITFFRCSNCSKEWETKEFEQYILTRVVRSVTEKSPFKKE